MDAAAVAEGHFWSGAIGHCESCEKNKENCREALSYHGTCGGAGEHGGAGGPSYCPSDELSARCSCCAE